MLITFSPNDVLQLVVGQRIYVFQYDSTKRFLTCNGKPLQHALEEYERPKVSDKFIEENTNTKIIKPGTM